jgi:riboflavin transporter FmnP
MQLTPRKITYTALFLALAIVLPIGFHQFGIAGRLFLPMHIPALLAGFIAGWIPGLIVGLLAPFISHLLTAMPPAYAVPLMTLELPMYAVAAAVSYRHYHLNIYVALIIAMIVGRLAFAAALLLLGLFMQLPYGPAELFAAGGAFAAGLPGMILQILIIPPLVAGVKKLALA